MATEKEIDVEWLEPVQELSQAELDLVSSQVRKGAGVKFQWNDEEIKVAQARPRVGARIKTLIKKINVWIALVALRRAFPECLCIDREPAEGFLLLLLELPSEASQNRLIVLSDSRLSVPPEVLCQM